MLQLVRRISGRRWLTGALFLFLVIASSGTARGHVGGAPDLVVELESASQTVRGQITAPLPVFQQLSQIEISGLPTLVGSAADDLLADLQASFAKLGMFSLDGVVVTPIAASFSCTYMENFIIPNASGVWVVDFRFSLPTKSDPDQIGVRAGFPGSASSTGMEAVLPQDQHLAQAMVVVNAGGQRRVAALTALEPEFVWHSEKGIPKPASLEVAAQADRGRISLVAYLAAQTGLVLLALFLIPKGWLSARSKLAALAASFAVPFLWLRLATFIPCPIATGPKVPPAEEALELFSTLHRNVYRAFDYGKESDIYDTLARSVDGRLLQWIYNEIHQSLVLRTEGGAVCQIQRVEILDRSLAPTTQSEAEAGLFKVRCRWKVLGAVEHWGHIHSRTNRYEAVYTVAPIQDSWKIVDLEILDQEREIEPMRGVTGSRPTPANLGGQSATEPAPLAAATTTTTATPADPSLPQGERWPTPGPASVSVDADPGTRPPEPGAASFDSALTTLANAPSASQPAATASPAAEATTPGASTDPAAVKAANAANLEEFRKIIEIADQGNSDAQLQVAEVYFKGLFGIPQDKPEGLRRLRKAADQGNVAAQSRLATLLYAGSEIPRDLVEASGYFRKAAEKGDAEAAFNLGVMFDRGEGVPEDPAEAVAWYRKAADQGKVQAQFNLGMMYYDGRGVTRSIPEAIDWFRKAGEKGEARAQFTLGVLFANGGEVGKNASESFHWFKLAAEQGDADAQYNLGILYERGAGCERNPSESLRWLKSALAAGSADARRYLAERDRKSGK